MIRDDVDDDDGDLGDDVLHDYFDDDSCCRYFSFLSEECHQDDCDDVDDDDDDVHLSNHHHADRMRTSVKSTFFCLYCYHCFFLFVLLLSRVLHGGETPSTTFLDYFRAHHPTRDLQCFCGDDDDDDGFSLPSKHSWQP